MCNLSQVIKQDAMRQEMQQGFQQGFQQGVLLARCESLLEVLEHRGWVPKLLRNHIQKESNLDVLKLWFSLALCSDSIEQFMKHANL